MSAGLSPRPATRATRRPPRAPRRSTRPAPSRPAFRWDVSTSLTRGQAEQAMSRFTPVVVPGLRLGDPPEPGEWAASLARALIEALLGHRPRAQLRRWFLPELYSAIESLRVAAPVGPLPCRPLHWRACSPSSGVSEVAVTIAAPTSSPDPHPTDAATPTRVISPSQCRQPPHGANDPLTMPTTRARQGRARAWRCRSWAQARAAAWPASGPGVEAQEGRWTTMRAQGAGTPRVPAPSSPSSAAAARLLGGGAAGGAVPAAGRR